MLQNIVQKYFPALYAARAAEEESPVLQADQGSFQMPLFIINCVVFPGMSFPLHIFEPRYRLMLRRALEGSRHFGIVCLQADRSIAHVGTTVEILSHVSLMDGRSLVETIGRRRFEVHSVESVDSYAVGTVSYIDDEPDADNFVADVPEQQNEVDAAAEHVSNDDLVAAIVAAVAIRSGSRWEELRAAVTEKYGQMPADAAEFSMWFGSVLPVDDELKLELLSMRSVRARLLSMRAMVRNAENNCIIQ